MEKSMKAAVYTGSRNIYPDMITAAKSLAANSDVDVIYMLTEDPHMGEKLPDYIKIINVSDQKIFRWDGPNMSSGYTYLAMMRAALANLFPEHDRILSLDADAIAVEDVSDVWELPVDGCYFAAPREHHKTMHGFLYTNTGVALYNLDMLRETGKADEVISVLNRRAYTWLEQDVFNYLCQGYIYDMPAEYNANDWTLWERVKIRHFAGHNDWRNNPEVLKFRNMSWEEIAEIREARK